MKKTIIFGTGQFAEVAFYYMEKFSDEIIEGFTVNNSFLKNNIFHNRPIISFEDIMNQCSPSEYKIFIPFNYIKMNKVRESIYNQAKSMGYEFSSYKYCK